MTDDLNHRCRGRSDCVGRVPITADGKTSYIGSITPGPDTLCQACIRRLQDQLEQLPHLMLALRSFLGTSMTAALGSKVSSTSEHSTPINLRTLDLIDLVEAVMERAGGPTIQVSDLVSRAAEEFSVGGRRRLLDGVDRALAIGVAWRKADSIVGLSRTWVRRVAPCPRCGLPTLGMWSGESTIHCTNGDCAESFPLERYESLCIAKAELQRLEGKGKTS